MCILSRLTYRIIEPTLINAKDSLMHTKRRLSALLLVALLLAVVMTVSAQNTAPPVNPNANISWPPPVYVLRGEFTLRGSANLPNMTSYFIQFRPLAADLSVPDEDAPWLPAILPSTSAVQDGVLGVWNTLTTPDGLYELRMTINVNNGDPLLIPLSPVRVENNPPPFAVTPTVPAIIPTQAALPTLTGLPPLLPTPTAFDTSPRVTAARDANVRSGDGTNYDVIGGLLTGETAQVVGVSSFGTGWYLIVLPNGTRGWVAPSVVNFSGDIGSVPRVAPPPTPTPPATATPTSQVNLVAGNFRFDPGSPKCNETFNVYMDVANFGTVASSSTTLLVQDFRQADGSFQEDTFGGIPVIQPGQTVSVGPIPLTISTWYNEQHRLVLRIDPNNQIFETNEADNVKEALYTLERASCP
jgi:hypothetical protein